MKLIFVSVWILLSMLCIPVLEQENTSEYWRIKGGQAENNQSYQEALEYYNKSLEINNSDWHTWFFKASLLDEMGFQEEALQCYDKTIELGLGRVHSEYYAFEESWINKGNIFSNWGRYEDAIACYNEAIAISLNGSYIQSIALMNKGLDLDKLHKYEEAIICYRKILEDYPASSQVWALMGSDLYKIGKYNESVQSYQEATQHSPNTKDYWLEKYHVLNLLNRTAEADAAFAKAKELGYKG